MTTEIKDLVDATYEETTARQYLYFEIEGKTPILMNNPEGSMQVTSDAPKRKKAIPTPEEEAERSTYKLANGDLYIPSTAIRNCILNGSKGLKVGSRAASPYVSGSLLLVDECFSLVNEKDQPIRDYIIDTRRVVIQRAGIMRSRARIETPWYVKGTFLYNEAASIEVIRASFEDAGLTMGIMDYRIEKKGPFGSFAVKKLEII